MSKETYILKSQVHFGSLKTSVPKGTKIVLDRNEKTVEINGVVHDNISDIDLGIRAGYVIPFVEGKTEIDTTVKISPKALEKNQKMEVHKSDMDVMPKEIDISDTKKSVRDAKRKEKMTVSYEKSEDTESRGMKVVANEAVGIEANTQEEILKVVNGDGDYRTVKELKAPEAKVRKAPSLSSTDDAKDVASVINGEQGTVVKKIGKGKADTKEVGSGKKLVAKHASKDASDKAKANAEARKKAIAARRAKESE